jgi:phage-related protein
MADGASVGVISLDLVIKNKVQEQLDKISASIQNGFSKPVEQAEKAVENAMDKTTKAVDEGFGSASEIAQKSMQEAVEKAMAEYDKLSKKAQEAAGQTDNIKPKTVQVNYDPEYDTTKVEAEVNELTDKIVQKMQDKTKSSSAKISQTAAETANKSAESVSEQTTKMDDIIAGFAESAVQKIKTAVGRIKSGIGSAVSFAGKAVKSTLGGAFKTMRSAGSKAVDAVKSKFSRLKTTIDSTSKPLSKFTHSLKSAAKRVFLMAGVLVLLKGIRSAVANAVSGNEEFAKSLNEIKANLTIAFTPIMNTVMPYLNTLMSGVATATKTVAAFISELFGTTYQKSLQATKQAQKSAEKIKKTQDTYLADFDVVRVAPDQSKSDTDSSEGGIDYSAINGDNVQLPDWAERMKDAIKSGDWAGVGSLVAEKVNGAFAYINWDGIQKKLNGFVDKLTDGLNSFINGVDWTGLGDSFGGGINTIFGAGYRFMKKFDWAGFGKGTANFLNGGIKKTNWSLIGKTLASKWQAIIDYLYSFVTTFNWSGFGSSIGTSVNGWFDEIDWGKAGTTISEGVKGLLDTAINFLQTVNWQGIGEKLWTFISTIDWSGIATKLFKAIGSAIGGAVSVLWGFIKDAVFSIRDYFTEKIQDCGGNIVEGLFTGIVDAFKGIGTWLYDHVLTPFIEGFKNCFGIHSPSKVMAEMGGYIIQGLYNAVSEGIAKIKEIFTKLLNAVKGVFKGIGKWFKKTFSDAFGGVKTILNGIIMFVKSIFTGSWKKAWQGVKKIFKGVWDTLYSVVKAPINLIIGAVNKMTSAIESAVNWIIDGINSLSFDVPDWVPGIGGENFGFDLDTISIPEIPKLATGGIATAPTLAMVGDNRNAKADPEVISPLSKLQGMLDNGKLDEVLRVLNAILDWLKAYDPVFFGTVDSKVLFKCMQDSNNQYKRKTGVSAF